MIIPNCLLFICYCILLTHQQEGVTQSANSQSSETEIPIDYPQQNNCKPFRLLMSMEDSKNDQDHLPLLNLEWLTKSNCEEYLFFRVNEEVPFQKIKALSKNLTIQDQDTYIHKVQVSQSTQGMETDEIFQYYVGGEGEKSLSATFRLPKSNEESFIAILLTNMESNSTNSKSIVSSIVSLLETSKLESNVVLDLGSSPLLQTESLQDIEDYFELVQPITQRLPYYLVSRGNPLLQQFLSQQQKKGRLTKISSNVVDMVMLDTSLITSAQDITRLQKIEQKLLLEALGEEPNKQQIVVTDRPLYCSAVSEQCTIQAAQLREVYQDIFYHKNTTMVVSGGSNTYERTFPKHANEHVQSSDPTTITNPYLPLYVNLNGDRAVSEQGQWSLEKQPWSAFISQERGFGVLTVSNNREIQYNQYDSKDQEIDEFFINYKEERLQNSHLYFAYSFLSSLLMMIVLVLYRWGGMLAAKSQQYRDIIEGNISGIQFEAEDSSSESRTSRNEQKERETARKKQLISSRIEETELSDLTVIRNQTQSPRREDEIEEDDMNQDNNIQTETETETENANLIESSDDNDSSEDDD